MSPVPHARSSARQPGRTPARSTSRTFHAPIAAEREKPGDEVVPVGDRRKQARGRSGASSAASRTRARAQRLHVVRNHNGRMLPSQTVENYLKTIYLAQSATSADRRARPDGPARGRARRRARHGDDDGEDAVESGLVHYEPYMGVRLTPAGEKLASLVLRRHRLVELFLVKVLGHELGRSARRGRTARARRVGAADRSHRRDARTAVGRSARRSDSDGRGTNAAPGLPRPADGAAAGAARRRRASSIRTRSFLRFVEQHELVPGRHGRIESRDPRRTPCISPASPAARPPSAHAPPRKCRPRGQPTADSSPITRPEGTPCPQFLRVARDETLC